MSSTMTSAGAERGAVPSVLSVQSRVAYGHVGNAASVFPLQRLGIEAWALDTVAFSNHTGHGRWRGSIVPAAEIAILFEGIAALGVLPRIDAVLSGYLGDAATGPVLLDIVGQVRNANPGALFCCDPVIGDVDTGSYVTEGIAEFFRESALALADIVTPNRFELEYLTGRNITSLAEAGEAGGRAGRRLGGRDAAPAGHAQRLRRRDRGIVSRPPVARREPARCARPDRGIDLCGDRDDDAARALRAGAGRGAGRAGVTQSQPGAAEVVG